MVSLFRQKTGYVTRLCYRVWNFRGRRLIDYNQKGHPTLDGGVDSKYPSMKILNYKKDR